MLRSLVARRTVTVAPISTPAGNQVLTAIDGSTGKEPVMKGRWAGGLSGSTTALVAALAGRSWAVALLLLAALGMSCGTVCGTVCWLAARPNSEIVKIWFIEWRARSEPQAKLEAAAPQAPRPGRWLRRRPPPDSPP
jgi:uncharacterized iron-regulated membrane protein